MKTKTIAILTALSFMTLGINPNLSFAAVALVNGQLVDQGPVVSATDTSNSSSSGTVSGSQSVGATNPLSEGDTTTDTSADVETSDARSVANPFGDGYYTGKKYVTYKIEPQGVRAAIKIEVKLTLNETKTITTTNPETGNSSVYVRTDKGEIHTIYDVFNQKYTVSKMTHESVYKYVSGEPRPVAELGVTQADELVTKDSAIVGAPTGARIAAMGAGSYDIITTRRTLTKKNLIWFHTKKETSRNLLALTKVNFKEGESYPGLTIDQPSIKKTKITSNFDYVIDESGVPTSKKVGNYLYADYEKTLNQSWLDNSVFVNEYSKEVSHTYDKTSTPDDTQRLIISKQDKASPNDVGVYTSVPVKRYQNAYHHRASETHPYSLKTNRTHIVYKNGKMLSADITDNKDGGILTVKDKYDDKGELLSSHFKVTNKDGAVLFHYSITVGGPISQNSGEPLDKARLFLKTCDFTDIFTIGFNDFGASLVTYSLSDIPSFTNFKIDIYK